MLSFRAARWLSMESRYGFERYVYSSEKVLFSSDVGSGTVFPMVRYGCSFSLASVSDLFNLYPDPKLSFQGPSL